MVKKIKLTETELTRVIERVIKEQDKTLPSGIKKGSKEHAEWVRSQQGDGSDEILEALLSISQRLTRFVKDVKKGGRNYGTGETEDLKQIQKDVVYQIKQYLGTTEGATEGRTKKSTYKKHR